VDAEHALRGTQYQHGLTMLLLSVEFFALVSKGNDLL
ncbi:MAG: hypothetical protein RLY67_646, partial [Pseudomonadota bacterium]